MTILYCKHCYLEVITVREPERVIGRGVVKEVQYKHRKLTDDLGYPHCGKVVLTQEDITDSAEAEAEY